MLNTKEPEKMDGEIGNQRMSSHPEDNVVENRLGPRVLRRLVVTLSSV